METNNQQTYKHIFSTYITDPVTVQASELVKLEDLLHKFPYCPLLHAFNCKIFKETKSAGFEKLLLKAAVYAPDRQVLYSVVNQAESFKALNEPESTDYSDSDPIVEFIEVLDDSGNDDLIEIIEDEIAGKETVTETVPDLQKVELDEEEIILLENIASADFFAFEKKLAYQTNEHAPQRSENVNEKKVEIKTRIKEPAAEHSFETQEVSKYDDDQMPYSFLWWLHKTRNEHADTYQPYVSFKLETSKGIQNTSSEELDHQIKENIFHLQSPLEKLEKKSSSATIQFQLRRKEEAIIERFIREEPQIKPPTPGKANNENKARRSAEDPNDVVSETLAVIYSEQMLFNKAIDTYKKLSLKFPEKRTYFADQIRELEKKINLNK